MFEIKRTMQPTDADLTKLRYPCLVSVKYDGVKAVRFNGALRGRSFKQYRNNYLNLIFDKPEFEGFEGEIVVGYDLFADDLCRSTTSSVNSFEGTPIYGWLLYDYVTEETVSLPYWHRLAKLDEYLNTLPVDITPIQHYIQIVGIKTVNNEEELLNFESRYLAKGAEGVIIRDGNSLYKQGRTTVNSQEVLRLKRYQDEEGIVLEIIEGNHNENEAEINELGLTSRSSHKANLVPNCMVGSLIVKSSATGQIDTISAGKMTHDERKYYFENQNEIIGSIVKYKHFATGVKDKKRFPRFIGFRSPTDMEKVQ